MCSKRRLIELLSLIIGLFGLWVQLSDDYFDLHSTHTSYQLSSVSDAKSNAVQRPSRQNDSS